MAFSRHLTLFAFEWLSRRLSSRSFVTGTLDGELDQTELSSSELITDKFSHVCLVSASRLQGNSTYTVIDSAMLLSLGTWWRNGRILDTQLKKSIGVESVPRHCSDLWKVAQH